MGILWLADPDQIDRERNDLLPVNVGNHSPDARTGSDELESDSDLLDDLKQGLALRGRELGQFRQIAPEQLQRDIKRLHSRLDGHLDLQGMQDLSQDHGGPELGSNDLHLRTPEKAESQMIFKQAKSYLDIPSTRIQRHDLSSTELKRIGDIGNITVPLSSIAHSDQSHEIGSLIRT